jgi:GNAT superfamily N-acetyltransferase
VSRAGPAERIVTTREGISLRAAVRRDVEAIVEVVLESVGTFATWAPPTWQPPLPEFERAHWWGRLTDDHTRRTSVAATGHGEIVGVASWTQAVDFGLGLGPIPGVAHIAALFVAPRWWRRGVASALLWSAETAMREAGYCRGELWTPADGPARAFYEARGWEPDGRLEWSAPLGLTVAGYDRELGEP